jgi:1-acyl-sn-glycerol-3-phosphate acyltransferase
MNRSELHSIARLMFKSFFRVTVTGTENLPSGGGYLLAVNHLSRLDPPLVFAILDREDVTALVAEKYQKYPFFRWIIGIMDGIWINRGEADFSALRQARDFLRGGGVLGIAPEGTRSHTGALIRAKTGAAYLADKSGVPVIPVAISGTDGAIWRALLLQRPRIHVQIGTRVELLSIEREGREATLQHNTDEIMCRIAAMLPERYRGVYADHPRLRELLAQNSQPYKQITFRSKSGAVDSNRPA